MPDSDSFIDVSQTLDEAIETAKKLRTAAGISAHILAASTSLKLSGAYTGADIEFSQMGDTLHNAEELRDEIEQVEWTWSMKFEQERILALKALDEVIKFLEKYN